MQQARGQATVSTAAKQPRGDESAFESIALPSVPKSQTKFGNQQQSQELSQLRNYVDLLALVAECMFPANVNLARLTWLLELPCSPPQSLQPAVQASSGMSTHAQL